MSHLKNMKMAGKITSRQSYSVPCPSKTKFKDTSCCVSITCCSGDEGLRPQAPVKPQRNRKAMSCDAGIIAL